MTESQKPSSKRRGTINLLDPPVPTLETASKSLFLDALLDIITIYLKISLNIKHLAHCSLVFYVELRLYKFLHGMDISLNIKHLAHCSLVFYVELRLYKFLHMDIYIWAKI